MREIKFRAWCKIQNFMFQNVQDTYDMQGEHGKDLFLNSFRDVLESDHYEVMQYTGLMDKNSVDVYEGDILTVWMEGDKQTIPKVVKELYDLHLWLNEGDHYYRVTRFEVIGNIYENPELLGEK